MANGEAAASVSVFLASYRAAFERLDAPAVTDHFAFPCHMTSDPGEPGEVAPVCVARREDWIGQIERLVATYRRLRVRSARVRGLATAELSPRLVQTTVHWELRDGAGATLYDFDATYTLASGGGALRITALAHNEIPRLRKCLARVVGNG